MRYAMKPPHPPVRRQDGFAMIGMLLALVVLAIILVFWAKAEQRAWEQTRANAQGAAAAQFGVGVRGFMASVQGGGALPSNPYTVTGVAWLKAPACGGLPGNPAAGYVPCGFTGGEFGATFRTTVTLTPATNLVVSSTWFVVPAPSGLSLQAAASFASKIAYATRAQQTPPLNGMFFDVFSNAPTTAITQPSPSALVPADRGRVVLYASNAPSSDIWLRVDGTNQMLADLNMGGHSIRSAKDGSFSGSVRVQGTEEIDNGLAVTAGPADLRGGTKTPDVEVDSVGHMASQAIYAAQVFTGGTSYSMPKPDCSKANLGSSSAAIYVAMQGTGSPQSSGGDALYDAHANVVDNGASWTITPEVHTTTFSLSGNAIGGMLRLNLDKSVRAANPADQVLLVMTKCR